MVGRDVQSRTRRVRDWCQEGDACGADGMRHVKPLRVEDRVMQERRQQRSLAAADSSVASLQA